MSRYSEERIARFVEEFISRFGSFENSLNKAENIKHVKQILDTYNNLLDDAILRNLKTRWGEEWFDTNIPLYLIAAHQWAEEKKKELTAEDVFNFYIEDHRKIKDAYSELLDNDEELEVIYWIRYNRYTGKQIEMVFVTNKRILYVNRKAITDKCSTIEFDIRESIVQTIELHVQPKYDDAPDRVSVTNWADIPTHLWITNKRILAVHYENEKFSYAGALLEEGEDIKMCAGFQGLFIFTNKKINYFCCSISKGMECKTLQFEDTPSAKVISREKGFLKAPYEFVLSTASEEVRFTFQKPELVRAEKIKKFVAGNYELEKVKSEEMRDGGKPSICPICETPTIVDATYCTVCGYEFSTGKQGVGPFSFAFPAIENVYQASNTGSVVGTLLMMVFGFPLAILGGGLLHFIHRVIVHVNVTNFGVIAFVCGLIIYWILLLIVSGAFGTLVAFVISKAAFMGKSNNPTTATIIGFLSGLAGCVAYVVTRNSNMGTAAFVSLTDIIRVGLTIVVIMLTASVGASVMLEGKRFCKDCKEYMNEPASCRIPIPDEKKLLENLNARTFENMEPLLCDLSNAENYSTIKLWYCEQCKKQGFLDAVTIQTRYEYSNDGRTERSESRLIFSSSLEEESEIKLLRGLMRKYRRLVQKHEAV